MKQYLFSLALMMTVSLAFAQPGARAEMIQERVEAQRVAFLTQKLALTPDESARFWPIYNEYRDKQQELRRSSRPETALRNMSDAEAEKLIEQHFAMEENMLRLKKEYYQKLKTAIPPKKIAMLAPAEMEFNRSVLEKIRERVGSRD